MRGAELRPGEDDAIEILVEQGHGSRELFVAEIGQRIVQPQQRIEDSGDFLRIDVAAGQRVAGAARRGRRRRLAAGDQAQVDCRVAIERGIDAQRVGSRGVAVEQFDAVAKGSQAGHDARGRVQIRRIVVDQVRARRRS